MRCQFVTDCEGPISRNDNAFELSCHFIPEGDRFFTLISRYDDYLAEVVKMPGYKAGDTLRLIVPFLIAFGATQETMVTFSRENIVLVPGAASTLKGLQQRMPCFLISTSYEPYIHALCEAIGFPQQRAFCTRLDIDRFRLPPEESHWLREKALEITSSGELDLSGQTASAEELSEESRRTISLLERIFWEELPRMDAGRIIREVNPVGGIEKARAVRKCLEITGLGPDQTIYVGDSITDLEAFRLVRRGGGLSISFNGNGYALKEAEVAIISGHTWILEYIASLFEMAGRAKVIGQARSPDVLKAEAEAWMRERGIDLPEDLSWPRVEIVTPSNLGTLTEESESFRKDLRGEKIGVLG